MARNANFLKFPAFPASACYYFLSPLSSELKRLDIGIAALSDVRRPDCGEIMAGGHTYYWSGCSDGYRAQGVAVAMSNKLIPTIIEVTPVNERIMRLRIRHSLGVTEG